MFLSHSIAELLQVEKDYFMLFISTFMKSRWFLMTF